MKIRIGAALFAVLLVAVTAGAQSTWSIHTRAAEYAFARGDLDRAEKEFQAALEIAQALPAGNQQLETSLENLARFYEHDSDFDRAQPLYQLLLAAQEMRLGMNDPALLGTLYAVARVSQPMGDLPTVEASLQRFDEIAAETGGADPRQHWQALEMMARMKLAAEDEKQALEWQRKAVAVIDRDRRATEEERASAIESLANMELTAGEGFAAEQLYVRLAELRMIDDEADATPRTMAQGAVAAYGAGQLDTAERLAMRSLNASPDADAEMKARTVLADLSWLEVNRGTDDLDMLLAAAGDSQELARARNRHRALLELEGSNRRQTLSRLVQIEALRGFPDNAARWQGQLLELAEDSPSVHNESAMSARTDLVTLLAAANKTDQALQENQKVVADIETEYGPNDSRLLPVLEQRLELFTANGQKKEAKRVRKRIKKISR
jgi:tetratricopeptide (TPR) repeat protein